MKKYSLGLLAICALVFIPARTAQAGSLSLQPLRQELSLKPGQSITNRFTVRNTGTTEQNITFSAENFSIINEQYDYSFQKAEFIRSWIHLEVDNVTIKPGASKTITYTLGIPVNTEPGGRYIALFATTDPTEIRDQLRTVERAGLLLYITIPGAFERRGEAIDINVPAVVVGPSIDWQYRLRSTGSVHFTSRTTITVKNVLGHTINTQEEEHLIMPKTIRALAGEVRLGRLPGIYKITFKIGRGDDPAHITSHWVLYMPPYALIFAILLVVLGTKKVRSVVRSRRTKKQ